jgi:hypothetical protein
LHPVLSSALEPSLVVTMLTVAERLQKVIDKMNFDTDLKLVNFLPMEIANLLYMYHTTGIDELDNRCKIRLV